MKVWTLALLIFASFANAAEIFPESPSALQNLAEQGNAEAMTKLGYLHFTGNQVEKSTDKALALYTQAAEKGNLSAMNNLCNMYLNGYGVKRDLTLAFKLCSEPARAGHTSSMVMIAEIVQQIEEGPFSKDRKLADEFAFKFYKMAAERGHPHGQYMVGRFLELGRGTTVNVLEAEEWYKKAANQGHEGAKSAAPF